MAEQGRAGDQQSFLNNLLMIREQEIRILTKKLHHQAGLDSDGGSGISEGSLGSPEPQNLSVSPLRGVSPDAPCLPSSTQQSYSHYGDEHHSLPSNAPLSRDSAYEQRSREQTSSHSFDMLHDPLVQKYDQNHPYSREADDDNDRSGYWNSRNHHDNHQEEPKEAAREEEEATARLKASFLEQQHAQQHMALAATQALLGSITTPTTPPHPLLSYSTTMHHDSTLGGPSLLVRALTSSAPRRPRGEKKPIPDTLKDEKYFERRKRNNLAAKKSRDARKQREDEIAIRATYLEKENSILRAQVATLRDEAYSLRHLLLQKKKK